MQDAIETKQPKTPDGGEKLAENSKIIELEVNTKNLEAGAKTATAALKGLNRTLYSVSEGVREAFSVRGLSDYRNTVTRFGKDLADALLTLQLSFGRLKYAIADAVAPIASVFVPMLNTAIQAVIRFAGIVGQFLRGVLAGITGNKNLAGSAEEATQAEVKLGSAAKAAGKAVKRSLASFDQLERLNSPTGSGGGGGSGGGIDIWGGFQPDPISPGVQTMVDKVLALLAPLMAIDLNPLRISLQNLWTTFTQLAAVVGEALSFLWYEILTPFIAWILETLAPAFTDAFAAGLELVTAVISPLVEGIKILWEALKPVVAFIGQQVVTALQNWQQRFEILAQVFREKSPVIVGIFQNIAQMVTQMWSVVSPVLTAFGNRFNQVFAVISQTVGVAVGYMLDMLLGLSTFLSGTFTGNWEMAWEGVKLFLKSAVNGVITLLNSLVSRLASALNAVVRTANKLSFTVPEWVPSLGGKRFGVNLPYVSAPSIPYLAKGAVLPAGKPFLAMVGDQKHGTNIEAPLSTIQEAVALVMEDQTGAILRGFEASVGVQKEILEAVLGIRIGDEVLARAVNRYNRRLEAMEGGF